MNKILNFDIDSKGVGSISFLNNKSYSEDRMAITDPTRMATTEELASLKGETVPMFEELPMDNPEALKKKKKQYQNILSVQINRLMTHHRVEAAMVAKATGIPESTLHGWINFIVQSQDTCSNLKALAVYFGVTIDFLCFGTPTNEREQNLDDEMIDLDPPAGALEIA